MAAPDLAFATLNGLRMHYAAAGPTDGPPVILLHGFPEYWYGWRHQIPALAAAGYRVIAPDQRGYNLSGKPPAIADYSIDQLSADILALADHLDMQTFHLVGHDWGAAVAWQLAIHHPERLRTLSILNVPHPAVISRHLRSNIRQLLKSWYIFFFQIPWLPELLLGLGDNAGLANLLRRSSLPGTFSDEEIAQYRRAWRQPGARHAMLNWYRAAFRRADRSASKPEIGVPTQIIWGEKDVALGLEMAEESLAYCNDAQLHRLPGATHWVQHDEVEKVNRLLLALLDSTIKPKAARARAANQD